MNAKRASRKKRPTSARTDNNFTPNYNPWIQFGPFDDEAKVEFVDGMNHLGRYEFRYVGLERNRWMISVRHANQAASGFAVSGFIDSKKLNAECAKRLDEIDSIAGRPDGVGVPTPQDDIFARLKKLEDRVFPPELETFEFEPMEHSNAKMLIEFVRRFCKPFSISQRRDDHGAYIVTVAFVKEAPKS